MNERRSFFRKVGYGVTIAVLWYPLSLLSAPATIKSDGGKLSQLRDDYNLGQADLGEIDPASETIKLATLGLRGLATNLLWNKATHYKKVEDWTNLKTTLEQLAKLQPNFITFWKFQSWNLSYNVSVEFDDYHDRYHWVSEGIKFLERGNEYNRDNPVLLSELGWVNGHKIGRSDEKRQYRRLYREDDVFHPEDRPARDRDNWLVSKMHYLDAIDTIDVKGKSLGKKSASLFYSSPSKSMMNYAAAIEEEGIFELAVEAWRIAGEEWREYGNRDIEHSRGYILRYNDYEDLLARAEEIEAQLNDMNGGNKDQIVAELKKNMTAEELAVLETPESIRSEEQRKLYYTAQAKLNVTPRMIADQIGKEFPELRREAQELAAELENVTRLHRFTDSYKDTVNYDYWKLRCEFEQTDEAVEARELVFRASIAADEEGNNVKAKELYERAFDRWHQVFERYPKLKDPSGTTGDDVMFIIMDYKKVLDQLDEELPVDFPLFYILEDFDSENKFSKELMDRKAREEQSKEPESSLPAYAKPKE